MTKNSIEVIDFLPEHLNGLDLPFNRQIGDVEYLAQVAYATTYSWTGVDTETGNIIGCGGIIPLWTGVGEAWVATDLDPIRQKSLGRRGLYILKKQIVDTEKTYFFHRIQAAVEVNFEVGIRLAFALGFQYEGLMRRYGVDGKDYHRFSRITDLFEG